jgi:hypothetical protein
MVAVFFSSGIKANGNMIKERDNLYWIICDKCGADDFCMKQDQRPLANRGWTMNPRAKKFVHLCAECNRKRQVVIRIATIYEINAIKAIPHP